MDIYAVEAVLELKKQYPEIMLEMVSPFDAQAAKWAPEHRQRHDALFDKADIVTATGHQYTKSFALRKYAERLRSSVPHSITISRISMS